MKQNIVIMVINNVKMIGHKIGLYIASINAYCNHIVVISYEEYSHIYSAHLLTIVSI